MKKVILIAATLVLSITSANAQWWGNENIKGNGEVVTDNRSTSDYSEVQLEGFMNVELVAGTEGRLNVEAESNLQEYIITEVSGGRLKISVEKGVQLDPSGGNDIRITVPFKDLERVSLTGSGDIRTRDRIKVDNFSTNVTGSGNLQLDLDVNNIEGAITGSGDVNLKGTANNFRCKVTGSGDFEAYDLRAKYVEANISGSGDIMVNASEKLTARVTGSGDISYKGNPEKEDFRTSGSGSVSSY